MRLMTIPISSIVVNNHELFQENKCILLIKLYCHTGASSMEVVRLIEELEDQLKIQLRNIDVFLTPVFSKFVTKAILARRANDEFTDESM